jgi:hypothetical protein
MLIFPILNVCTNISIHNHNIIDTNIIYNIIQYFLTCGPLRHAAWALALNIMLLFLPMHYYRDYLRKK